MDTGQANHYEVAFESWLGEARIPFVPINQTRRLAVADQDLKSFDFLLWPDTSHPVLAEVKGRTFSGRSLAGLRGLDCWTTAEDTEDLLRWQELFRPGHPDCRGVFVFAFRLEQVDVAADGLETYTQDNRRYVFFAVEADAYLEYRKQRSPKWQTVTLGVKDFRKIAIPLHQYMETVSTV